MPPVVGKVEEVRKEIISINLFDLDRLDPESREKLLAGRLDPNPMKTDWDRTKGKEEVAVKFTCGLLAAAIICDTIRSHDRVAGDFPTRLYLYKKAWSRVPSYTVLTIVVNGRVKLNPEVFPAVAGPIAPLSPPALKRITW